MGRFSRAFVFIFLVGAGPLLADEIDVGALSLFGSNQGSQTISASNYTGAGCNAEYNVCNTVNIINWQLSVAFTPETTGLPASPLIFNSGGPSDNITNGTNPYSGDPSNPWNLSFDLQNTGCSPTCDAYISQIILTGTLANTDNSLATSLTLYTGPSTTTTDFLSSPNFSVTWNVPLSDYTDPTFGANTLDSLFDQTDLIFNSVQQTTPAVPEPHSLYLFLSGVISVLVLRRIIPA